MPGGYAGKLLRVDLSEGSINEEPLPRDDVLRQYIGGLGLGARIIYDEVPLTVSPLDPENRLVFMTGPLTGTTVPGSSDWTVVSIRQELDGKTIHGSHSHGYWGAFLKMNGIDGIILQGAAPSPVYLWVHDGQAEIRDAAHLWGLDTHETEDAVREELGGGADISIAAIGPAGENLVPSAMIENDKLHSASKGMGCIMGAKKLKAIAISRGIIGIPIADPIGLLQATADWRQAISGVFRRASAITSPQHDVENRPYHTTGKNYSDPEWARWEFRSEFLKAAEDFQIDAKSCWGCPSACAYRAIAPIGPHAGYQATLAGGNENMEGAAAMAGIAEPGTVLYLTDLIDRLGVDAGSVACAIGLAIEAYEKGMVGPEKTDGLELRWGDAELTEKLWRMACARTGFGAVLAEGPRKTAEYIGGEAMSLAVHVKGASPNLHDWRARPSIILGQATSPAGPCWQGSLGVEFAGDPDLGWSDPMDPWDQTGKGKAVARAQMRAAFEDCHGVCWFGANMTARRQQGYLARLADSIAKATGWTDFSAQEVLHVGERVMHLQRVYAIRRGMTKADDLDIGPRLLEPHRTGITAGLDIRPHLQSMIEEFYEGMGWDRETGIPLASTLQRAGLEALASDLEFCGQRAAP